MEHGHPTCTGSTDKPHIGAHVYAARHVHAACPYPFCMSMSMLGFPFYVKKLFTRNIVTDVTDGYYVVITVVTT